jgi:hypothetical protein
MLRLSKHSERLFSNLLIHLTAKKHPSQMRQARA